MSKKISNDESCVENISIKDRPMNVADEYCALRGNLWIGAKMQLDAYDWNTGDTDEGITKNVEFLESILTTSALKASEFYDNVWKILAEPISFSQVAMTGGQQNVPQQLRVQVGDYFRISADRINYDYLVQTIKVSIQEKHGIKSEKSIEELWKDKVSVYVTNCAQLGWKMAIQRPPMEFRKPGLDEVWTRKGEIEPAWGSRPDKKNAKVRYYQHPVMYHGDKVMIRGMAMIS